MGRRGSWPHGDEDKKTERTGGASPQLSQFLFFFSFLPSCLLYSLGRFDSHAVAVQESAVKLVRRLPAPGVEIVAADLFSHFSEVRETARCVLSDIHQMSPIPGIDWSLPGANRQNADGRGKLFPKCVLQIRRGNMVEVLLQKKRIPGINFGLVRTLCSQVDRARELRPDEDSLHAVAD